VTWWVWVVAGWSVASLAVAFFLGGASAEVSRRERHASTTDELDLPALLSLAPVRGARRRVPGSRPGVGAPPPRPVSRRVPVTGARRPVASGQRHPSWPREVPGRGPARQHRLSDRPQPARTLRAVPSVTSSSAPVVVLTSGPRVRTPPPPARPRLRLASPRVQRAMLLSCVPVLALAPLLASSTSSLGKSEAIAAELAAHPDQKDQLIAALDRGRVLAGLTTPVTAPGEPAPAPSPAPEDDGSVGGGAPVGTRTPTPSGSPTTSAPATGTSRTAAPQRPTTAGVPPVPGAGPDVATPTDDAVPTTIPTTPARPEPTPAGPTVGTPTPTPSPSEPTPSPTPSPTDPTPTPTDPVDPTPTDPEPTPTPTEPAPTESSPVEPEPSTSAPTPDAAAPAGDTPQD
jgi:hypothetical protein